LHSTFEIFYNNKSAISIFFWSTISKEYITFIIHYTYHILHSIISAGNTSVCTGCILKPLYNPVRRNWVRLVRRLRMLSGDRVYSIPFSRQFADVTRMKAFIAANAQRRQNVFYSLFSLLIVHLGSESDVGRAS